MLIYKEKLDIMECNIYVLLTYSYIFFSYYLHQLPIYFWVFSGGWNAFYAIKSVRKKIYIRIIEQQ